MKILVKNAKISFPSEYPVVAVSKHTILSSHRVKELLTTQLQTKNESHSFLLSIDLDMKIHKVSY
jgi:hypothetical protein